MDAGDAEPLPPTRDGSGTAPPVSHAGAPKDAAQPSALASVEIDLVAGTLRASENFASVAGFALDPVDGSGRLDGEALLARVVERDRERVAATVRALSRDGSTATLRCAVRGDDGNARAIEAVVSVFGVDGRPRKAIATVLDLSTGRRVEATLRESEARYRSALKAGRMGSWETDLRAGTRSWSSEAMALFGFDLPGGRGTVGGDRDEYEAAMHPDDRHLAKRFHALADEVDSFPAEYRIVRPDGTLVWLSGRGLVAARAPDGKAERLISIMADVTERRHAEEALRKERERVNLALSAGQMGAFDLDIRDDVLWWSPQTYAVFGLTPETFTPTREGVAALVHPDDRSTFLQRRAAAIAQHEPLALEFRILRPDGAATWVSHRGQVEYDAAGRPVRSFGITMDITERKHAEQALREADRQKDDFIATLAHELRNPLAPIRNAVELLRRTGQRDPQVVWCRDVIERQVAQMAHLLDDLLDVSRMTHGQFHLRHESLQLETVVERAIEIAQPIVEAAGHALVVELPEQPVALRGDLTRLAQVISNLLINAAKYTAVGGRIRLAATVQRDELAIAVQDNGIGIEARQLPRIFEMFGQVESALARSQGGLGIGLSLAKGLVELHGGRIEARSAGLGQGSEFLVHLPVDRRPLAAAAPVSPPTVAPSAPCRLLVADDLREIADSLARIFELMGHTVEVAYDGEDAVRRVAAFRPEVALLDLGMPKLNGYDACRRIRATAWGRGMTLIAQTGWGQDEDRRRTREVGFDHHVLKPIDPGALLALFPRRG
jgi:PAS domain S-box-containing protein